MRICAYGFEIPEELHGEDVYNMLYVFDNEDEAIDYIVKEYNIDRNSFLLELHEFDLMRDEFGKEHYLRTASVGSHLDLNLNELMTGEYILWESY